MKPDAIAQSLPTGTASDSGASWALWGPRETGSNEMTAHLYGRAVSVRFSPAALHQARSLVEPLTVEMELYFSCFVRKAVRFRTGNATADVPDESRTALTDRLFLQFRPATTQHCRINADESAPPLETMPVKRPQAFLPRWIDINFKNGTWLGEFGY